MRTFAVFAALLLLIGLGFWQLQRREWKEDMLAHIQAQMAAPPLDLDQIEAPLPIDLDYRHVKIRGVFLPEPQFHMPSKVRQGQVGVHIVSLFQTAEGVWLVNRGWVPNGEQDKALPPLEPMTITGITRSPPPPGPYTPANDPIGNMWYSYDLRAMLSTAQQEATHANWVIEMDAGGVPPPPYAGVTQLDIPNNHLQYALTWFSLAGILLVMAAAARIRK